MEGLQNMDENTKKELLKDQLSRYHWDPERLEHMRWWNAQPRDYVNYRVDNRTVRVYNPDDDPWTDADVEEVIKNSKQ